MKPNNIKCPKCSSTQLYFDKKGFSGKKAVVGAVLTGGVGLLAGTLGSNKVVANCLSCGNKFSPVKQNNSIAIPAVMKKPLTKTQQKINMWSFSILTIILLFLFIATYADSGFSFLMFLLLLVILFFGSLAYYSYQLSKPVIS